MATSKGSAIFFGMYEGANFEDACMNYILENDLPIDRYDKEKCSFCGFTFYDNEQNG